MGDDETTQIDCELGAMSLTVTTSDTEDAVEIFEKIWEARIDEKQTADALEMRNLEKETIDDL